MQAFYRSFRLEIVIVTLFKKVSTIKLSLLTHSFEHALSVALLLFVIIFVIVQFSRCSRRPGVAFSILE
jgi:hypothetical protein